MAERGAHPSRPGRGRPRIFTIPVHRRFADALVNGLIARFGSDRMALARGLILTPNNRAARAIQDAFVRRAEGGLLLPRMTPIGEAGEEALGPAFDTLDGPAIPPAIDPLRRRMMLARLVQEERARSGSPVDAAEALRLAADLAATLDVMTGEEVPAARLHELRLSAELSAHWAKSLDLFAILSRRWPEELARFGAIDLAERRNRLLRRAADAWRETPPPGFVVAAGVTSAIPAIAGLLRVIARLDDGMVVLPGLDLASPDEEWIAIAGSEGAAPIESHPQHQLRLLLDRIEAARSDVARWRWGDGEARQAVRARAVSNAFAPAQFTRKWIGLPPPQRKLPGVALAEFATPADEAQGIAIALREALDTPGRTAALVTPDRALARRVAAHLERWGVAADDSAGRPLSSTPSGVLIQAVVAAAAEGFAPAALLALLKHPLVMAGATRLAWLDGARRLDRALRGPRPAPGLAAMRAFLAAGGDAAALTWWDSVLPRLARLETAFAAGAALADAIEAIRATIDDLAGDEAWAGPAGRAAAALFADLARDAASGPADFTAAALPRIVRLLLDEIAVRPAQGGHPRLFIRGLIEARLQSADLTIAAGLNEGVWPAEPAPDPWLAPRVRAELGLGGLERRIGAAAHDLAAALGGRDVLLTRSRRDATAPTIESRFLLRLKAMLGKELRPERRIVALATAIDAPAGPPQRAAQPAPSPPVAERPKRIAVTSVDRLKADPFAFYAQAMLKLRPLDAVDAEPGPAWRGSAVHAILDAWHKEDGGDPARLIARVDALLSAPATHPIVRALWQPRLHAAIARITEQLIEDKAGGRRVIATEIAGAVEVAGVTLEGRADRVDRIADGTLAIVDYKTGKPPSKRAVAEGFSMQLGLIGLIAEAGGFAGITGTASAFEYWSLAKKDGQFGYVESPVGGQAGIAPEDFVKRSRRIFADAAREWLTGDAPFTAKLHPDYSPHEDYDQLMRRDEWYGRERGR